MKNDVGKDAGARFCPRRLFGGKFSVHPLFFAVGIWHAFTGQLPLFVISALVALIHEYAHALVAQGIGYELQRVVLMPYGATLDLDFQDVAPKDEIAVALAGPLCNFACAALFLAVWWCFPETYAYTDTAFYASLAVGVVNLLPAYPLDGGRVLRSVLQVQFLKRMPPKSAEKRALRVCRLVTLSFAALCVFAFVFALCNGVAAVTLAVFALFLAVGALPQSKTRELAYRKLDFSVSDALKRGVLVKRVAVTADCTVKRALRFLSRGEYLVLDVYDENEKFRGELTQNELARAFLKTNLYAKLGDFVQ